MLVGIAILSPGSIKQLSAIVDDLGFEEGSDAKPGDYVIQKAFVD
jgi:ferredoxin--NADP+ reductase